MNLRLSTFFPSPLQAFVECACREDVPALNFSRHADINGQVIALLCLVYGRLLPNYQLISSLIALWLPRKHLYAVAAFPNLTIMSAPRTRIPVISESWASPVLIKPSNLLSVDTDPGVDDVVAMLVHILETCDKASGGNVNGLQ